MSRTKALGGRRRRRSSPSSASGSSRTPRSRVCAPSSSRGCTGSSGIATRSRRRAPRCAGGTPAQPGEPEGIAALRAWAWKDLDRVALVSFDVEGKPEIERKRERERREDFLEVWELRGTATFVVDGFRADGARVERAAKVAFVLPNADAPPAEAAAAPALPPLPLFPSKKISFFSSSSSLSLSLSSPPNPTASRPIRASTTRRVRPASARRAAIRPRPLDEPAHRRHLAGLGRRGPGLRSGRRRGPLRGRRRPVDPVPRTTARGISRT